MITEATQFVRALDPMIKSAGIKPKEGLHILLRVNESKDMLPLEELSLVYAAFTREKAPDSNTEFFLKQISTLIQLSWCVNTNKCFDLPVKAIHSCSPYCFAVKRENLVGGEKYKINASEGKHQVYERVNAYFTKALELLDSEEDKRRAELFRNALNTKDKWTTWLEQIPAYTEIKDAEYVIFYLDEPVEKYQVANSRYLSDKLFNTSDYNHQLNGVTYGTSDFFNSFPAKKPFLTHQSAPFDIAGRISADDALNLFELQQILDRDILPRPLPIFIHEEELEPDTGNGLRPAFIKLINTTRKISYREIIEELYDDHREEFGNYYLLFYHRGEIKDFDFVSKFEYELIDHNGDQWVINDYFNVNYQRTIANVFGLQNTVLRPVFNNALISKNKTGEFQYRYFEDIDAKYCRSANTYLLVTTYRKAFYDFIYKSRREAVSQTSFDKILLTSILDDIRLDEFKNNQNSQKVSIRQKLNIWFSLSENFNQNKPTQETMANKLQTQREFMRQLAKGEAGIQTDDQYAFAAGQVIYYLLTKSKTADRSYKRLEPFMQQVHAKELNKAISRLFDSYKHESFSVNFRIPFAEVLSHDTSANIRDYIPAMLSGIFSANELFSDAEEPDQSSENKNEE